MIENEVYRLGKIVSIEEIHDFTLGNTAPMNSKNGSQLGFTGMLNILGGGRSMDGYKVSTIKHNIYVLIDNRQSCCENWGYIQSEDDLDNYIGALVKDIKLTDIALNQKMIDFQKEGYFDDGGIQFVDFQTSKGSFQLAVYNGHNGYYGHGIIVCIDDKIVLQDTL
jgi:hypothetical protein